MPDVRMNYDSMESMSKAFHQANQQVQDAMKEMDKVAKSLEDGALLGTAGDAFREAIRSKLMKRMDVIANKMSEMESDIHNAVRFTRDGVSTARNRFTN